MPQVFQVLKCYKCLVFQVHQTKKSNKWECKMCGEKQSIKRHYGIGTGKECRLHVQKLNGIIGEIDEDKEINSDYEQNDKQEQIEIVHEKNNLPKASKWTNFVEKELESEPKDDDMFLGNTEVVLEVPKKKRKFNNPKAVKTNSIDNNRCIEPKYYDKPNKITNCSVSNTNSEISFKTPLNAKSINKTLNIEENNTITKQENISNQDKHTKTGYIPPKVSKNSKWAQFTEEENDQAILEKVEVQDRNSNLFSLCDENELDDVLTF